MKTLTLTIVFAFIIAPLLAQNGAKPHPSIQQMDCYSCHSCEIPTKEDPCLISCPREHMVTMRHSPDKAPEIIIMDELGEQSDLYDPVSFSHKIHAEMSEMLSGCTLCHHYNPPGRVVPCKDCHEPERMRTDISKPDLKGAYHRQCIDCHREWGGSVQCAVCHTLKDAGLATGKGKLLPALNPAVGEKATEPEKIIYETGAKEGAIVTFYHNEHTGIYQLACTDCHKNEACGSCHGPREIKPATLVERSHMEAHLDCAACHDTDAKSGCQSCHAAQPMPPFDHERRSGFALTPYHLKLSCADCHSDTRNYANVKSNCNACHGGWNVDNFNHAVTGLVLDENHIENDCVDCHVKRDFVAKPSCTDCHEIEEASFPKDLPGKRISTYRK